MAEEVFKTNVAYVKDDVVASSWGMHVTGTGVFFTCDNYEFPNKEIYAIRVDNVDEIVREFNKLSQNRYYDHPITARYAYILRMHRKFKVTDL